MYSKKSQSELIENKDYNMVLLLPHNATKIIYFSKSFSIRFFLLVIKEYYVFLKVAANTPIDVFQFEKHAADVSKKVKEQWDWMFETKHNNREVGKINFTTWSDVFICPNCSSEIIFYDVAVNHEAEEIRDAFICTSCKSSLTKNDVTKAEITVYDRTLKKAVKQSKTVPVLINYSWRGKRYEKRPDNEDLLLLRKIEEMNVPDWFPSEPMMGIGGEWGDTWRSGIHTGITHVHHFHLPSNNIGLAAFWNNLPFNRIGNGLRLAASAANPNFSRLRRYRPDGKGGGPLAGTLYISSITTPQNCFTSIMRNVEFVQKAFNLLASNEIGNSIIFTNSCTQLVQKDNSVDYIFTDPPFGANIMYSELNFLWESWLKVKTNNKLEAIENRFQGKSLLDYQNLMTQCFHEYFRILKPGKWMTVEFSNTSAAVWNGIQTALQRAGFVIANIAGLDKKQGSFKAITTPTAVKQDLVISCYKPTSEFEFRFDVQHGEVAMWDFITEHLYHLPTHIKKNNSTNAIIERSSKILYDRLITFYLMRGLPVPIDAKDFQDGLKQRFVERDGMFFSAEQVVDYDDKKAKAPQFIQLSLIITNESDAIEWLKDRLRKEKQKYQDITNDWKVATQALRKGDKLPELIDILKEGFIQEPDGRWRTPDPNETKDRDALRKKVLIKEFNSYVSAINQPRAKKLKEVRVEALRAGFKYCWELKDFKTIVTLGDMIPQNILLEDEQLLMYYDIAKDRV